MLLLFLVLALGQQEKLSQQGQKLDQLLGQQGKGIWNLIKGTHGYVLLSCLYCLCFSHL